MGLLVVGAALRESIPGRDWSRGAIALWLSIPIVLVVGVTLLSWEASPVFLRAPVVDGRRCCVSRIGGDRVAGRRARQHPGGARLSDAAGGRRVLCSAWARA